MQFDASTIFVLALVVGIVVLLSWAEINSRRQKPGSAEVGGSAAAPLPSASVGKPRTK